MNIVALDPPLNGFRLYAQLNEQLLVYACCKRLKCGMDRQTVDEQILKRSNCKLEKKKMNIFKPCSQNTLLFEVILKSASVVLQLATASRFHPVKIHLPTPEAQKLIS